MQFITEVISELIEGKIDIGNVRYCTCISSPEIATSWKSTWNGTGSLIYNNYMEYKIPGIMATKAFLGKSDLQVALSANMDLAECLFNV